MAPEQVVPGHARLDPHHRKHHGEAYEHRGGRERPTAATAPAAGQERVEGAEQSVERQSGYRRHSGLSIGDFRKRFAVSLALTFPILVLSPMIQSLARLGNSMRFDGDRWVLLALASAVYLYGGYPFLAGFVRELRSRRPGTMTLVAVAITSAYVYSSAVVFGLPGVALFWELATLVDIMLLGHWIEMRSLTGASRALEELVALMPAEAHRLGPDGMIEDVGIEELAPGDRVLVRPGEKLPVDGVVTRGEGSVNESVVTGESVPAHKRPGDQVIGGSLNGEGTLTVEIRRAGKDSYLAQVVGLVREAQESKSRTQALADRAAQALTVIALGAGLLTLAGWLLLARSDLAFALERLVTVMVIACPHALGLAVPLVVASSTALSARSGLLLRNRVALERARGIGAVIFDKTGTLTRGELGVTDTIVLDGRYDEVQVLGHAASVEAASEHPIARAVVKAAPWKLPVERFRAHPGKGAEGVVGGKAVTVASPAYLRELGVDGVPSRVRELAEHGKTVVFVRIEGRLAGAIALADTVRDDAAEAVSRLRGMGISSLLLSGDNRRVASWVGEKVGVDEVLAEVLPHEKAAKVKEIQSRGLVVAVVGDGVNDAPALAQADVGIAVGAGTDVAVESADVVLVRSSLLDAVAIIGLARATYRKMLQNLAWAAGYNVVAIPLAAGVAYGAGVLLSPALGAILMSLSTVIVAINSRKLRVNR